MSKNLFIVLCLFTCTTSYSQDYVVTLKSDTISGDVKLLSYDLLDRVQVSGNGKKKETYTALQVRRVSYKGDQYAPVKYENSVRLMKVVRSGFLSLYAYRATGQSGYDTRVLQKIGGNTMEVPNIGFKKFVGDLVSDCPTVADKVKNGDFDRGTVDNLVDQYNVCISDYNQERIQTAASAKDPAIELIDKMKIKLESSNVSNKNDVNDLLNSIADRVRKKESVPPYMKEGLKGYIGSNEDLKGDMEQLFNLIDN